MKELYLLGLLNADGTIDDVVASSESPERMTRSWRNGKVTREIVTVCRGAGDDVDAAQRSAEGIYTALFPALSERFPFAKALR